jgi:serine/threonine protein phosphatase 1
MRLGEAQTPDGMRIYAIGDIHGCDTMLADMHQRIAADLAARPVGDHRIIHIGDYIDRGPDSAAVIRRLAAMIFADPRVICLRGNHDQMLLDFLADPEAGGSMFLGNGGKQTLRSFGVSLRSQNYAGLARRLAEAMSPAERSFTEHLRLVERFGDFVFVHAGIRPGVPLDQQNEHDLIWIREEFLTDPSDHGFVVVHGHTPADAPEVLPNRINIDTGAVYGGPLTCVVLEGMDHRFL